MKKTGLFLAALCLLLQPLHAQELLSESGDWKLYSIEQDGRKICYLASSPTKSKGTFKKRTDPYFLVTHKSADQDEVSASSGFLYKADTDVHVTFGNKQRFRFFTKEKLSWARDSKADRSVVNAMEKNMSMTVRGTARRGTYAEDTYSLKGFSKALQQMKNTCK